MKGEPPGLMLIYPQGNPLQATEDSPLPPDRRDEVRPADPRPRHPVRQDDAGRGGEVRAAVDGLDDEVERDGRPADRPAGVHDGRAGRHPPAAVRRRRPGPGEDPRALGTGACGKALRGCPTSAFASVPRPWPGEAAKEAAIELVESPVPTASPATPPSRAAPELQAQMGRAAASGRARARAGDPAVNKSSPLTYNPSVCEWQPTWLSVSVRPFVRRARPPDASAASRMPRLVSFD